MTNLTFKAIAAAAAKTSEKIARFPTSRQGEK
jgi:hypothetical protein